tara:strand:- start:211 stop:450 length:240 start_codon:yes stop_codon:yes gene_type:complete
MMFSYKIISTIQISDHADKIDIGDEIYGPSSVVDPEPGEFEFETDTKAKAAAQTILNGLDGGRAFNLARDSAKIVTFHV